MKRFTTLLLLALLSAADHSGAQPKVEIRGIASKIKLEEVIFGHLGDLNGKFKLRVTELTFDPEGHLVFIITSGPAFATWLLES